MAWSVMSRCFSSTPKPGGKEVYFSFPSFSVALVLSQRPTDFAPWRELLWHFLKIFGYASLWYCGSKEKGEKKSNSCYFSLVCSSHCRYVMSLKERRRDIWIFCICTVWIFTYCPCWIKTKKGLFHLGSALGLNSN